MPRNMSFALTTEQIRNRTKTVTRRLGWANLKRGDVVNAVKKNQGFKKGEKIEVICQIRIVSNFPEPLTDITDDDVTKEGFPELDRHRFVQMFLREMNCFPGVIVNRIEFEYVEPAQAESQVA